MTFLLLSFIQARTPLSWAVVVAAVLAFIAGVWLFVYFYKRYKLIEKETEEDWDLSRRSLFVNAPSPSSDVEAAETSAAAEVEAPVAEEVPVQTGGTREFAADISLPSFTAEPEPPQVETAAQQDAIQPEIEAPAETRATKILASPSQIEAVSEPEATTEDVTFDEDVWADLEVAGQPPVTAEHEVPPQSPAEPLNVARVEQPSHRAPFEQPRSDRVPHHEPSGPPVIEPLASREPAATRELRSAPPPGIEQPSSDRPQETMARGTVRLGSASEDIPEPIQPLLSGSETRELTGELVAATPGMISEPSLPKSGAPRARMFGSVLGLPAEYSHQPLILGEPVRPADEMGIGALTHYGKDLGPKGGKAGTIALSLIVALLAGAAALYFFVPAVHSPVDAFIARLRGTDSQDRDALKPKAQIIPSTRLDPNKNMVTARGAVDNLTDAPLENLSVEVSLKRGGEAPPETRTIPVNPNPLPPRERGTFEFEYDGKRDTGFAGYTITRLLSNGTEVRFRTPAQK